VPFTKPVCLFPFQALGSFDFFASFTVRITMRYTMADEMQAKVADITSR
jgi:hypothetical protein